MFYTSSILENSNIENVYYVINNNIIDPVLYNILGFNKPVVNDYSNVLLCKEKNDYDLETEYRKTTKFITRFKIRVGNVIN
jgi:hypothetical protein